MNEENVKKRLMFVKGEDFYFLTYNIYIFLDFLNCNSESERFRDYRKLAFIIDFIADTNLTNVMRKDSLHYNINDRDLLNRSYANGLIRLNEILKLLFALEKHKIVTLFKDPSGSTLDVFLNKEHTPPDFLDEELFKIEKQNVAKIKAYIPKVKSLKLDTLLSKLYYNYGIKQWEIL